MQDAAFLADRNRPPAEIRIGQLELRFLIDGPVSKTSVTIFEMLVPPGARVPVSHSHDAFDETIYGLEGVLTMTLQGKSIEILPREVLFIPRGAVHRFDNPLPHAARVLVVITPGILGSAYFREIAAVVNAAGGPPSPSAIAAVMLRHGLTPAA